MRESRQSAADELREALFRHKDHSVSINLYGDEDYIDVCLECDECGGVVIDPARFTLFFAEEE